MKRIFSILLVMLTLAVACKTQKAVTGNPDAKKPKSVKTDSVKKWTYNRVLKTTNYDIKYVKANEYFDKGKYDKALELYNQLVPHEKGLSKGEEVSFKQAMCTHKSGDHLYGGYLFKTFYQTYPTSKFAEESLFMSAFCYFIDAPRWSLDQSITLEAISQFQLFMNKYPKSKFSDSCNIIVDKMQYILEHKSYENAKLYFDMEYYKAAKVALNNAANEFPDSRFKEDILYNLCKASYDYALQSIRTKQIERYKSAISDCLTYKNYFPNGKYFKDIDKIQQNCKQKLNSLSK